MANPLFITLVFITVTGISCLLNRGQYSASECWLLHLCNYVKNHLKDNSVFSHFFFPRLTNDINAFYFLPSAVSQLFYPLSAPPLPAPTNLYCFPSRYVLPWYPLSFLSCNTIWPLFIYLCDFHLFMPLFHLHVEENTSVSFY
jgi:hypothetical protein